MSDEMDGDNESLENPLREDCTREAAAEFPVTYSELDRVLAKIQEGLEPKLNDFYESSWIEGGAENHLFDCPEGVFFAFTATGMYNEEPMNQLDIEKDMVRAVFEAHQNMASVFGFDVDRPTNYADTLVDDYSPFYIAYPENWLEARYHERLRIERLLLHNLTPTEALDHWALEDGQASLSTNKERERWHAYRDVDREAIRKTLRQAREKLDDPENQPYHQEQNIETKEVEKFWENKEVGDFRSTSGDSDKSL